MTTGKDNPDEKDDGSREPSSDVVDQAEEVLADQTLPEQTEAKKAKWRKAHQVTVAADKVSFRSDPADTTGADGSGYGQDE